MEDEYNSSLITATKVTFILNIIGIISLIFLIPTFFISKVLRSHPGKIILYCCITELAFCYSLFIMYLRTFYLLDVISFDIYEYGSIVLNKCTFQIYNFSNENVYFSYILSFTLWLSLFIFHIYYTCLSLDLILIIRNPFYPPDRRIKIYHFCAIGIPLLTASISKLKHIYIYIYRLWIIAN